MAVVTKQLSNLTDNMDFKIRNLIKAYGKYQLDIPSLDIESGEFVGLVGNNGAGKTTLLRLMLDLLKRDSGEILNRDSAVHKTQSWKTYTSAYLNESFLIDFLTPKEYFEFIAHENGWAIEDKLNDFRGFISEEIVEGRKLIRGLSSGNRQKVGLIGALINKPQILLLDEPFNFLDPSSQEFMSNYLAYLNKNYGITIVLSGHNVHTVHKISSRIILLENGKVFKDIMQDGDNRISGLMDYFRFHTASSK